MAQFGLLALLVGSIGERHGDGSLFCAGPGGKPVPTIRLENFRDGLEDYAYVCILKEIIEKYEFKQESLLENEKKWLAEAKALGVPEGLVKTLKEYSRDPKVLYAWRNRMSDLIDESGMVDVNPWGSRFNVRGFESH